MDNVIKWALSQALGTVRGGAVFAIYQAVQGSGAATNQAALLVVVQWALGQLLGSEKGAAAFSTVSDLVASN